MKPNVAVVGGGPAGAFLALQLASAGLPVTVFDNSHPREKPCGGLLSEGSLALTPVDGLKSANEITHLRFRSPFGREFRVRHPRRQVSVSRAEYDASILARAVAAGAVHRDSRVRAVVRHEREWEVRSDVGSYAFPIVCGADGVRSVVARATGRLLPAADLGWTVGFFSSALPKSRDILIRFGDHVGYCWVIPRSDHASIGGGAPLLSRDRLLHAFHEFLGEIGLERAYHQSDQKFSWMIPFARSTSFIHQPRAGADWLLVGDAAGFCDPLTGEGIRLALESANLAAQAIISGNLPLYDSLWRRLFGSSIRFGILNRRLLASRPMAEMLLDQLKSNPEQGLSFFKML